MHSLRDRGSRSRITALLDEGVASVDCLASGLVMTSLILALLSYAVWYPQQVTPASDIKGFFLEMAGEWIGTFDQSTNKVKTATKYLHAVARQTDPDSFETLFTYYKIDPQTQVPVDAGTSIMVTKIASDGTATNTISGTGDVLIDPKTLKSVQHQVTEKVRLSSANALQGSGTGTITVLGMRGPGRYGKVFDYASTWSINHGMLQISQRFKVRFRVLFFGGTYSVATEHTLKRGKDIMSLVPKGDAKESGR